MKAIETIRAMMDGMSVRGLGKRMGRSPYYAKTILYGRKSTPNVSIFAEIADVCGYDLLVRKRDDGSEIVVEPNDD